MLIWCLTLLLSMVLSNLTCRYILIIYVDFEVMWQIKMKNIIAVLFFPVLYLRNLNTLSESVRKLLKQSVLLHWRISFSHDHT